MRSFLALFPLLLTAAAPPFRPAPIFEGPSIPDPPRQGATWTPPETKLPAFLIRATAALFDSGMADPRGCAYREVEIGDAGRIASHAFVLPDPPNQFAVGWNGIIYPVFSVGPEADLASDLRRLAEALKAPPPEGAGIALRNGSSNRFTGWVFSRHPSSGASNTATVEMPSALKLCLLLRLGRADLAEELFAAATPWTPEAPRRDLTDYQISVLSLAQEWAGDVYERLLSAHQRANDVVALDAARRLHRFLIAVDKKAEAMGFPRPQPLRDPATPLPPPYLQGLTSLDALLADHERRAKEPPRGPIPPRGGDPARRIAALIRDFDQINVPQISNPGSANPAAAPIVREVAAEGDAAVEPLLEALVSDTRLTRSVTGGRGPAYIHPVTDAVYGALRQILKTDRFVEAGREYADLRTAEGRRSLASAIRAFWEKNRDVPLTERWYRTLRDDSAGTDRWLEAAAALVQPVESRAAGNPLGRGKTPPMQGEPLRSRRDPSVSELLVRRAAEILRSGNPNSNPDIALSRACSLARSFARWDEPAAISTLETLSNAIRDRALGSKPGHQQDRVYGSELADFTLLRAEAGDRKAIEEYASWVRAVAPEAVQFSLLASLKPMWTYPRHPAIAASARAMFLDPDSPWLPLVPLKPGRSFSPFEDPIASPLLLLLEFRAAVLEALADKTPAGTARREEQGGISYRMNSGLSMHTNDGLDTDADEKPGVEVPVRICDAVASKLSALEGAPECRLDWPEPRRDAGVAACAAYLRRFGRNFSVEPPLGILSFPHPRAHLRFPTLDRPATRDDVETARAIFSLEGEGETRLVSLAAAMPIRARWTALEKFPRTQQYPDRTSRHNYLQDGLVWQAEEVHRGDHWERLYGFVGHATIARVPASEIELSPQSWVDVPLPSGLNAELSVQNPSESGEPRGRPVVVTMRLGNRLGVNHPAPTEFIRRGDDGKPSLRRGLGLELSSVPVERNSPRFNGMQQSPGTPLEPIRKDRFDPTGASRTLGPTESFEALSLDLTDWFGPLKPARYRFRITFAADSGLGEGKTNEVYFTVGEADPPR